jgi:hypothetical protein
MTSHEGKVRRLRLVVHAQEHTAQPTLFQELDG